MAEQPGDLKKLITVATDMAYPEKLRRNSIEQIGRIASYDALRALLDLAATEQLTRGERELALKHARNLIRAGH